MILSCNHSGSAWKISKSGSSKSGSSKSGSSESGSSGSGSSGDDARGSLLPAGLATQAVLYDRAVLDNINTLNNNGKVFTRLAYVIRK